MIKQWPLPIDLSDQFSDDLSGETSHPHARVGLCDSLKADEKRTGALALARSLDLDVPALREAGSLIGHPDSMEAASSETLFVFCGAIPALCVTDTLHRRLSQVNYVYIPQATRLICASGAESFAKVYALLGIDIGEEAIRRSAVASRSEAGVPKKQAASRAENVLQQQPDSEYIGRQRKAEGRAGWEYECTLCNVWIHNGNWGRGHCAAQPHRARKVCSRVGGGDDMKASCKRRKDDTVECLRCPGVRVKLTEAAWREHILQHRHDFQG